MDLIKKLWIHIFGTKAVRLARKVNWKVNKYEYLPDTEQFGLADHLADVRKYGKGDCEDFAWAKVEEGRSLGLDITLARSRNHAVALMTDRETGKLWVLDLKCWSKGIYEVTDSLALANGDKIIMRCGWYREFTEGESPWVTSGYNYYW